MSGVYFNRVRDGAHCHTCAFGCPTRVRENPADLRVMLEDWKCMLDHEPISPHGICASHASAQGPPWQEIVFKTTHRAPWRSLSAHEKAALISQKGDSYRGAP